MPNPETHYHLFFKDLRLGDFMQKRPMILLHHTPPEFQTSVGAAKAHGYARGGSAWWEVSTQVAFKRGYNGAETASAFWDRIRTFATSLATIISPTTGHSQMGPLCFVRDANGTTHSEKDLAAVGDASGVEVGTSEQFTTAVDISTAAYGWSVGQYLLFIDEDSATTFDWEVAKITAVSTSQLEVDVIAYAKDNGTKMYRLDWHMPEVALLSEPELDGSGPAPKDFLKEIELRWGGTLDPINGEL